MQLKQADKVIEILTGALPDMQAVYLYAGGLPVWQFWDRGRDGGERLGE